MKKLYTFIAEYKKDDEKESVNVVFSKPTQRQLEDAQIAYAAKVAGFMRDGVMTRAMIFKMYDDKGGGIFPESMQAEIADKKKEYVDKTIEFQRLESKKKLTAEDRIMKAKIQGDITRLQDELVNAQMLQDSVYDNSAETLANRQMIYHWLFELVHLEDESGKIKKLVEGKNFEDRKNKYFELVEAQPEFFAVAETKIWGAITFVYYNANAAQDDIEKHINEFVSSNEAPEPAPEKPSETAETPEDTSV